MPLFIPFLLSLFSFFTLEKADAPLPNILWITSEDNGPFLGCYGDAFATTPNIDRIAHEGMIFTSHYAGSTVCWAISGGYAERQPYGAQRHPRKPQLAVHRSVRAFSQ